MPSPGPGRSDHLSDVYFADLPLPVAVRAGIAACGFVRATPIQAETLPLLLAGKDVAAQAQTGTGKTAAYLVSILTRLVSTPRRPGSGGAPRALVVAPTRELAVQIQDDAVALAHFTNQRIVTVYGGLDYAKQRDDLRRGCDLLVGTPGRLLDYEEQRATSFADVESLVVDEADRLFDLGFIRDLRRILRRCPPPQRRHSMLFSATLSYRVMELAYEHMNDAVKIEVSPEKVTADRVTQALYHVGSAEKLSLLLGLVRRETAEAASQRVAPRFMLFINTKRYAERVVRALERHGHRVGALTGDLPQAKRLKILHDFKAGKLSLLVATDVASRGLHIDGVTHVVNVDLPQDPEDYVHRIGRTARAGRSGKAISLACEAYVYSLDAIERLIGAKIPVEFADEALFLPLVPPRPRAPLEPIAVGASRHVAPSEDDRDLLVEPPPEPAIAADVPEPFEPEEAEALDGAAAANGTALAEPFPSEVGPGDPLALDFWAREAFGIEIPEGGFSVAASASAPSAGPRKKRRRRRRPGAAVPAPEAVAAAE